MLNKTLLIAATMLACAFGSAQAGTPTVIKNSTGTAAYGTESLMSVEKDTSEGNRVRLRYAGSGGIHFVTDDAAWSVHAKFVASMAKPLAAPASTSGLVYDIARISGVNCQYNMTVISWPDFGQSDYLSDNCAMRTAILQNAQ